MANKKKTHEEFVKGYNEKHPNVTVMSKYLGIQENITLKCNICNYVWTKKACNVYGCPQCENERKNKTNTHNDYLVKLRERNIIEIIPIEKYIQANKKILHKCQKCGYEWNVKPNNVLSGFGCPACYGNITILGKNDLWTTNPDVAKLLLDCNDGYKYSQYSSKKVNWKCPECNSIVRQRSISNITQQGLRCDRCSDGISVPNKFISNIMDSLHIDFETEKSFKWANGKRYDIYISKLECIIEINGLQHTGCGFENLGGRTLKEEQENDKLKEKLAKENGIQHYITIDAKKSELEYIKNNILNSKLVDLISLSNIDWTYCYKLTQCSKVITAINLWNQGHRTPYIRDYLHISDTTVCLYLHRGNDMKLCRYDGFYERYNKVVCLTTGFVFDSIKEAGTCYNIKSVSHIGSCCRGERNYCGKHPTTNKKLQWQYYDEYIKITQSNKDMGA